MTEEEKVNYLRLALGLCEIRTDIKTADMIWRVCELVKRKRGKTSVEDTCKIFVDIREKYPEIEVKAVKNPEPVESKQPTV